MTPPTQRATRRIGQLDRTSVVPGRSPEAEDADRWRADLSAKLVRIRPLDAVRFVFNDVVDRRTFRVRRTTAEPNTLSISYADDARGAARQEASATSSRGHWMQSRSGQRGRLWPVCLARQPDAAHRSARRGLAGWQIHLLRVRQIP
ncbi:MAG: hypothetical protein V9H69_12565 [Anaerolineae bacterium]